MKKGESQRSQDAGRELLTLLILFTAGCLFILNGSRLFSMLPLVERHLGSDIRIASTALILNAALMLFGWRRYVDIRHQEELRDEHKRCETVLATTDAVTGLYNRKGFADLAEHLRADAAARGQLLALLSFQIHRLKTVKSQHGSETGDRLLKTLSVTLADAVGSDAVLGRLGIDEFAIAVALHPDDRKCAATLAETVLQTVAQPLLFEDRIVQVGAFVGIAYAQASDARVPDLLRRADIAMDHARSGRQTRPVWFEASMERALVAHGEIEQGIRFGLEHGQFVPFFEPQVDLESGEIVGFEVLARWKHPLSGVIGPDVFFPVAQEIGLIGRLSASIMGQALREAASWDPAIRISINISPFQFADGWLAQRLLKSLAETGFPAERLTVEIADAFFVAEPDAARAIITSLKNQRVRIALDGIGAGASSIARLRSLPIDMLKLDRKTVTSLKGSRERAAMVRQVMAAASSMRLPVCVEGIENESTLRTVTRLGCGVGQGWYFGKPMPGDEARALLESRNSDLQETRGRAING